MSRGNIIEGALYEAGRDWWKPSVDEMIAFYTVAGLTPPTRDMIQGSLYGGIPRYPQVPQGIWELKGGMDPVKKTPAIAKTHWCGIFATYVLKEYGGLPVKWVRGTGIKGITPIGGSKNIKPGDVAVFKGKKANPTADLPVHHFIVTALDSAANRLQSVDGNSLFGAIQNAIVWHRDKKIKYTGADADPFNIWYYYPVP